MQPTFEEVWGINILANAMSKGVRYRSPLNFVAVRSTFDRFSIFFLLKTKKIIFLLFFRLKRK